MSKKYQLFIKNIRKLRGSQQNKQAFLELVLNLITLKKMSDIKAITESYLNSGLMDFFDINQMMKIIDEDAFISLVDTITRYDFSSLSDVEFAQFHNLLVDEKIQKNKGQVFTGKWIIDYMIEKLEISENMKMLEPSVGFGNFVSSLMEKFSDLDLNNLTLFDIDPIMLKFTELMIKQKIVSQKK